jgi:hypothetical protein
MGMLLMASDGHPGHPGSASSGCCVARHALPHLRGRHGAHTAAERSSSMMVYRWDPYLDYVIYGAGYEEDPRLSNAVHHSI